MTDVLFYDFDFNLLADFPKAISINFTQNYCGYGTAELHFSLAETEVLTLLEENSYVFFKVGENSAIVTGWKVGEDIAVFGRTPEWLLAKRGVAQMSQKNMTPEEIVRVAVSAAADFVTLGQLAGVGTPQNYSTDKVRVLYDIVCEVLGAQGLGFRLTPDVDGKQFVFSVYSGQESLCMISPSNRTAYDMTYTIEKQDMVTKSGWYEQKYTYMGGWDAYNNVPALSNNNIENIYRFYEITSETYYQSGSKYYPVERFGFACTKGWYIYCNSEDGAWKITDSKPDTIWVYLNNSSETGPRRWDAVLSGTKTEDEAVAEILQMKQHENTESVTKSINYGTDYCIGDIVTVQTEFGDFKKVERKRVTSVNIYYDIDKSGVTPMFSSLEE